MKRFHHTTILLVAAALISALALAAGCSQQGGSAPESASAQSASSAASQASTSSGAAASESSGSGSSTITFDASSSAVSRSQTASSSGAPQPTDTPQSASTAQGGASGSTASGNTAQSELEALTSRQLADAMDAAAATADNSGMQVGVALVDLSTNLRDSHLGDVQMPSASMIKLIVAYAFLEQVESGAFSLDDYYTLQASDIVGGTGTIGSLGAGAQVSYSELLNKMISVSDNTATNILIDAIGMDAVNACAAKLGLDATQLNRYMMDDAAMASGVENYTSANDIATLLAKVYEGTFVNGTSSMLVLQALEQQQDNVGILAGLPAGVTFAHKTGTLPTVRHDGGIVEIGRPFVLVTLCGGAGFNEQGALDAMAQIGASSYAALMG